jgi:hypothetical protein
MTTEHRDLIQQRAAVDHVLDEMHFGPDPNRHVLEIRLGRRIAQGKRAAVGDVLRADRIAIIVHGLADARPQAVGTDNGLAIERRSVVTGDMNGIGILFD